MQYVYVLLTPMGFILGVFSNREAAEAMRAKVGEEARISQEPVIN